MLEEILKYERNAFFFLNGSDSPFLDHFMWLFSGKIVWIPLALIIICTLAYKKNWRETVFILLAIALTITLCDQFASHICKPIFHRFRPTHHPDFMEEVKGSQKSPVSTCTAHQRRILQKILYRKL